MLGYNFHIFNRLSQTTANLNKAARKDLFETGKLRKPEQRKIAQQYCCQLQRVSDVCSDSKSSRKVCIFAVVRLYLNTLPHLEVLNA